MTAVELHGYHHSVYLRIVRFALEEKGVGYTRTEVNPFVRPIPAEYLALHPFGRVPALVHDGFRLYETVAITRYIDEAFAGPPLQPTTPRERARMVQIQSVVDNYAYWPLVRQVFSHAVFRPQAGGVADPEEIRRGLEAAPPILKALADLAATPFLAGAALSLADIHLAPMIAYFVAAPAGLAVLDARPGFAAWWQRVSERPAFRASDPGPPGE